MIVLLFVYSGRIFKGLATNWLKSLQTADTQRHLKIPVAIHTSNFNLPRSRKIPVIMIASGTGLAPFRAFIQERLKMAHDKGDPQFEFIGVP